MRPYATMFASWLIADNGYFEYLLANQINPEIGLQHGGLELSPARHRAAAAAIKDHGLNCSIHLPFVGLATGSGDGLKWQESQDILLRSLEMAAWYEPDHLIGHPDFMASTDSLAALGHGPAGINQPSPAWLERSSRAWGEVLSATGAALYLENTYDQSPEALLALLELLPAQAALCFDLGHWFCFAQGHQLDNLSWWLQQIASRLGHLHLHDNHGQADQHLGIGRGLINYDEVLAQLTSHGLHPTFTLEAHHLDHLICSRQWLADLPPGNPLTGQ